MKEAEKHMFSKRRRKGPGGGEETGESSSRTQGKTVFSSTRENGNANACHLLSRANLSTKDLQACKVNMMLLKHVTKALYLLDNAYDVEGKTSFQNLQD